MKRMIIFFGILILLYSVYYDLNKGTLRLLYKETATGTLDQNQEVIPAQSHENIIDTSSSIPFIEIEVKPGDTVLSLVEESLNDSLPVSIEQVISDFEELNEVPPSKIQIGKTYKIPQYQ
ncbi:hypothetical protein [Rossellomorea aquimaris]|uniref:hypothetical protein n=1 Tax=Rossellomorea aquimaris TaxID=189382 RepID=UPI0007D07D3B|nr:hypothetical protein [Rossellomorea aquimaris]